MISKIALALLLILTFTTHLNIKDETPQQVNAALDQFEKWGSKQHGHLLQITWRKDGDSPWTARIYDIDNPNLPILWEEVDYPRLMLAVTAVEYDYAKYPQGHTGEYDSK